MNALKPVDGKTFLYREHENTRAVPTFESNKEHVILGGHRYVEFVPREKGRRRRMNSNRRIFVYYQLLPSRKFSLTNSQIWVEAQQREGSPLPWVYRKPAYPKIHVNITVHRIAT